MSPDGGVPEPASPLAESRKLKWFIAQRWIAFGVAVALGAGLALFGLVPRSLLPWLGGWAVLLAASNVLWTV